MNGIYHVRIYDVSKHPEELIFDANRCMEYVSKEIDKIICTKPIENLRIELHALNLWYWALDKGYSKQDIDKVYDDNRKASMARGYDRVY